MIQLENTPNYAGVYLTGDWNDFDELYDALHFIIGEEGEFAGLEDVQIRVLGVCYDLRYALMGGRGARFVPNGLDRDKMRMLSIAGSESNIYLQFEVLWPELLFVSFALDEFIECSMRSKKLSVWNQNIAAVRKFQAAVHVCLEETLPESKFKRIKRFLQPDRDVTFRYYTTQYIDDLNLRFIDMEADKRFDMISVLVKRVNEKSGEYMKVQKQIEEAARYYGEPVSSIRLRKEYPETIDW